jgi:hypothetical protein
MMLPPFLLPKDVHTEQFDLWLDRFAQRYRPSLILDPQRNGATRLYDLKSGDTVVVQIAILPRPDGREEVRVARVRGAQLFNPLTDEPYSEDEAWDGRREPLGIRPADQGFCARFYLQVRADFWVDLARPRPGYPDGALSYVEWECAKQTYAETELLQLDDAIHTKWMELGFLRQHIYLGIAGAETKLPPLIDDVGGAEEDKQANAPDAKPPSAPPATEAPSNREKHITEPQQPQALGRQDGSSKPKDSGHFHYPHAKRREIVRHFREDRQQGKVNNKETWAQTNYQITSRTLRHYEKEFPEET